MILLLGVGVIGYTTVVGRAATSRQATFPPPPSPPPGTAPFPKPNFTVVPPTVGPQEGIPAITPTLKTTDPKAATFTEQDARNYIAQVRIKNHPEVPAPVITSVRFLTVAQVASTLSLNVGFDTNELVCVVQLNESGTVAAPGSQQPKSYTIVFDIYNARTGYLLSETLR